MAVPTREQIIANIRNLHDLLGQARQQIMNTERRIAQYEGMIEMIDAQTNDAAELKKAAEAVLVRTDETNPTPETAD